MTGRELLTIGAFGRLAGLTPSALRFYDDCGLLHPARVDPGSGYRLYSCEQEPRAVLLRDLRAVGLPLADARAVLEAPPDEVARRVQSYIASMEEALLPAKRAAAALLANLDAVATGWRFQLPGIELASAVRQVAAAAATDCALPALQCVLIETDVNEIRLVATDRHRLAVRVLHASDFVGSPGGALVPADALLKAAPWGCPP